MAQLVRLAWVFSRELLVVLVSLGLLDPMEHMEQADLPEQMVPLVLAMQLELHVLRAHLDLLDSLSQLVLMACTGLHDPLVLPDPQVCAHCESRYIPDRR